jgi:hypothetical protein
MNKDLRNMIFKSGAHLKPGDLAAYFKHTVTLDEHGNRRRVAWMAIVTKVRRGQVEIFDPSENCRYKVRVGDLLEFHESLDDLGETKALRDLDYINDISREEMDARPE